MSDHYIEAEDNHKVTNLTVDLSTDLSKAADLLGPRIEEIFGREKSDFHAETDREKSRQSPIGRQRRDKR